MNYSLQFTRVVHTLPEQPVSSNEDEINLRLLARLRSEYLHRLQLCRVGDVRAATHISVNVTDAHNSDVPDNIRRQPTASNTLQ